MSHIDIETLKFRKKGVVSQKIDDPFDETNEYSLKPESICYYEADCFAYHIINRQRIGRGDGIENPGLEEVWNQELERRKQLNMSIASKSLTQGRINSLETDSHYKYEQMFWLKIGNLIEKPVDISEKEETISVHYPAESLKNSQVFDAVDISCHSDTTVKFNYSATPQKLSNDSLYEDVDSIIVDETIALNSSLPIRHSQVFLDNEDMDLIDILKEMDEEPIEKDSILGTPSNIEKDELSGSESEDAEYSQIFHEDTVMECTLTKNKNSDSELWQDSYWDGANIPQLDGAYDDEHSKKVRKRKMRPFKLGLSRPKSQKTEVIDKQNINFKPVCIINESENCEKSDTDTIVKENKLKCTNSTNEIKLEFIDEISDNNLENNKINSEKVQCIESKKENDSPRLYNFKQKLENGLMTQNMSKTGDINKIGGCMTSKQYDILNGFEVAAGSSKIKMEKKSSYELDMLDSESDHENNLGIQSFYNSSKIFNMSIEDSDIVTSKESSEETKFSCLKKEELSSHTSQSNSNSSLNLHLSEDSDAALSVNFNKKVMLMPRIKPPSKEYILSTLPQYNIPKTKNVQPYYSNFKDVGDKLEIGHLTLKLQSNVAQHQKPFEKTANGLSVEEWRHILFTQNNDTDNDISNSDVLKCLLASNKYCVLEPVIKPPRTSDILIWLKNKANEFDKKKKEILSVPKEISEIDDELDENQALGLNEGPMHCSYQSDSDKILNERVPKYSYAQLAEWWNSESNVSRWIAIEYYLTKLSGTVRMLEKLDIIKRTSELARLFGLQWWEVLSRGSQFRVESLMLRAARPLNLVALSPTVKQRAAMKAPECLPLIFEPDCKRGRYRVLDRTARCDTISALQLFQLWLDQSYEFGAWRLRIPKTKLETLVKKGLVHWSPVGIGFVKPSVRRGVLPALLRRILAARQAVKKSMKLQTDEAVKKAMHSRQLGLKLIANVTYGYTAANFSGRMPCVEVGDSVVAKGRETLERAVKMVENNPQWHVKVVYGDTDSIFVLVPGGTRAEAFEIGQQIADAVTADNPSPVALKLEKVYQPCILQTKKRYVGYMYESPDQQTPTYEAKGIETVRRDGCPAGVKLLQKSLCELFDSADVSKVKQIITATLSRLADGRLPHHELLFTREYNGPHGYRPGAAAPPAEIAKRLASHDRRAVPRTGERVSWLVCAGAPGLPLIKLARTPSELKKDPSLKPHISYYANRVILPPLHRCFSLLGVNVFKWWTDLGYTRDISVTSYVSGSAAGAGIARYLWRERCVVCTARSQRSICGACTTQPQRAIATVAVNIRDATAHAKYCAEICASCSGHPQSLCCENLECPVLWRRQTALQKLDHVQDIVKLIPSHMKCSLSLDF
ncbi:DNA polymerase zeta catalytic subunit [Eumeta japonica]|uniref:DNA polymerase n=1 Tax=Eumeta variegata TaxID=151549 RepID=A0A4C1VLP0_EUMVA|nr:DNA polymerase zeta catalytic subunit [Eumeta japonica]